MSDETKFKIDMLKQEIDFINSKIDHFDNLRLKIKQIAIVLWVATVGFGLKEQIKIMFFISAFLPLFFWLIDTIYRSYYEGYHHRLLAIKDFISTGKYTVKGKENVTLADFIKGVEEGNFPVFDYWAQLTISENKHKEITKFSTNFFYRTSMLVYIPMIGISLILCILLMINIKLF